MLNEKEDLTIAIYFVVLHNVIGIAQGSYFCCIFFSLLSDDKE